MHRDILGAESAGKSGEKITKKHGLGLGRLTGIQGFRYEWSNVEKT
jgi:hypothetical protein